MSHLHIPDGVLPLVLWGPGLALALLLLGLTAWTLRRRSPQDLAYQGALGALMLAVMAVELPLGPFEYHLSLVGPVGVLLGPAAAFQAVFVVNAILALLGHGGFTVIGLNALVLGSGAALARPVYGLLARRGSAVVAMTGATLVAQTVAGAMWLVVMVGALHVLGTQQDRVRLAAGVAFPLWLAGILVESAVAWGVARFIGRVRPDLLPGGGTSPKAEP